MAGVFMLGLENQIDRMGEIKLNQTLTWVVRIIVMCIIQVIAEFFVFLMSGFVVVVGDRLTQVIIAFLIGILLVRKLEIYSRVDK